MMPLENAHRHALRRILMLLDALSVVAAMAAAMTIHAALREHFADFKSPPALEGYLLLAYLTLPMWLALAGVLGLYRQFERPLTIAKLLGDLVQLHVYGLLGLTLLIYLTQVYMNRSVVALFVLLTFFLMFAGRLLLHAWLRLEHRRGHGQQRILLVTDSRQIFADIERKVTNQPLPPTLVGCLVPKSSLDRGVNWGCPILGSPTDLRRALHNNAVDLVLVSCSRDVVLDMDDLLDACDEVGVSMRCHIRADHHGGHTIRVVDDAVVPCIAFEPQARRTEALIAKRLLDVTLAGAGLIALSPALLVVAISIWLTMGRPVLLPQMRTGLNGRQFTMLKFRTMVRDAEAMKAALVNQNEVDGPVFKMSQDPRTTTLGRLLRRSSLDEIPQLWNVLTGSMSLVGPRPLLVAEQQRISGQQRRRLSMKPGMTGLWQVSGRSNVSFDQWMQLDLEYVDKWSLFLDIKLLLLTVPAVFSGRGAK